uniref:CSON006816 protein n=1 Tax=Culicoides sonorensis TaxID=179676 RepID=A0A336LWP1_CULSO
MNKIENDQIPRKTLELNFELKLFNDSLKSHMEIRTVDLQLLNQLRETTELIHALMSDCTLIETETVNVKENSALFKLHRQLYCLQCNTSVKAEFNKVKEHVNSRQHQKCSSNLANSKKEQKNNKTTPASQVFTNSKFVSELTSSAVPNDPDSKLKVVPVLKDVKESPRSEPQNEKLKLNKKVQVFLRDQNLEKLGRRLSEEGEKIKLTAKHHNVIESIKNALSSKYPHIKVYPFGSRISGLGSANSDLDIFIDLNENYYKAPYNIDINEFRYIEQQLKSTKQWIDFCSITGARTPILKAFFSAEQIPCDLSFSNGLSHRNTKFIAYLIELQPLFGKLACVTKLWASEADVKMNSYILTLLLVFYFQQVKLFPSVYDLQKDAPPKLIGLDWNGQFKSTNWPEVSNDFRQHLIGFYDFYGYKFDFSKLVICPFLGIPIAKERFHYGKEKLPEEMDLYMSYMKKIDMRNADVLTDLFAYEKPMVVQDPFEHIHNVSKGVRPASCDRFINYCKLTSDFLKTKRVL